LVVLTLFSGIAFFLGVVGVYGLLAYSVRQRTGEIGPRMALDSTRIVIIRPSRRGIWGDHGNRTQVARTTRTPKAALQPWSGWGISPIHRFGSSVSVPKKSEPQITRFVIKADIEGVDALRCKHLL